MLPKSFRAINNQIRGFVVFNTGGLVTPESSLIDVNQAELFANGSILIPFFGIEKWTADSPSGENHPKTGVSLLFRCLL